MYYKALLKPVLLFVFVHLYHNYTTAQIPSSGLVAYWPLNGNFNDAGPNAIHGTNFGATATADKLSAANNAVDFSNPTSAVNQYGTHPVNSNLNFGLAQDFSISFLMYIKSPFVHNMGIYDNNLNYGGYGIFFWNPSGNNVLQFNFGNVSLASPILPLATWKHVVCVKESTTLRIYIDGVQASSGPSGSTTPTYTYAARFGSLFFNSLTPPQYNGLHGALDEFRIYNRALSATEIANMSSTTLPLQLTAFTAVTAGNTVQLQWQTQSESNLSHFEIESSTDGKLFTRAGIVPATGNTTISAAYSFIDATTNKLMYYRLKMQDYDHSYTYSNVLAVRLQTNNLKAQLFPNPAKDVLQLQLPSEEKTQTSVLIHDFTGKQLYQQAVLLYKGNNSISIPVSSLPAGMYTVRIVTKTETKTLTFTK